MEHIGPSCLDGPHRNVQTPVQACENLPVDVIALDLTKRLPFPLRRAPVLAAVKRGVFFELQYSGLDARRTDEQRGSRATFLKQAQGKPSTPVGMSSSSSSSLSGARAAAPGVITPDSCGRC